MKVLNAARAVKDMTGINQEKRKMNEEQTAQNILDSIELSKEEKAELNLSKCAKRQK